MSKSRRTLNESRHEGSDVDVGFLDETGPDSPLSPVNGTAGPSKGKRRMRKGDVQDEVDAQVAKEMA